MTSHLDLATRLAGRYAGGVEPLDDLIQVARLGLLNAARRYDDTRGIDFTAYAIPMIVGELKRHFRDHCWSIHVPRGAKERAVTVHRAVQGGLEHKCDPPTAEHLARQLDLPERDVVDALEAWSTLSLASLDAPARASDEAEPLAHSIGSSDRGYDAVDLRLTLVTALRSLPLHERRIFCLRYFEHRTQSDIAARVGISQMQVSRVLRQIPVKLRRIVDADAWGISAPDASTDEPAGEAALAA